MVRDAAGIGMIGRGVFSNSMTIYFQGDLAPQLQGKPLSVIYINNPVFGGFMRVARDCQSGFVGVNRVGDPAADPLAASNAAADTSEARLVEIVRAAAGVPDLPVKIVGVARWRASTDVAERLREGRVFIAGDAAHLMLQYFAQGAAMAMEDAVCLAACADEADGDFPAAFRRYQERRLVRASRVQVCAKLLGLLYHAGGVSRLVRNDMYSGATPESYYQSLDWIFTPPDYVREFRR